MCAYSVFNTFPVYPLSAKPLILLAFCRYRYHTSLFDRPGFNRLVQDATDRKINLVLTKDLSRLGRDYIEAGKYTDFIFPSLGCRFIALNDGVDTIRKNNEMLVILKNVMNDLYARDTSNKIKAVKLSTFKAGKYVGCYAPLGYRKSAADKHILEIDPVTAPVVRHIFDLRLQGNGFRKIALILNAEKVPAPRTFYYMAEGRENHRGETPFWNDVTVKTILRNEVYLGHMVQNKTGTVSYKNHKQVSKPESEWIRVENTHEPLISQEVWDAVQRMDNHPARGRSGKSGTVSLFGGLLRCMDCGSSMRYMRDYRKKVSDKEPEYKAYVCNRYASGGKNACSSHYINQKVLTQIVLTDIRCKAIVVLKVIAPVESCAVKIPIPGDEVNTMLGQVPSQHGSIEFGQCSVVAGQPLRFQQRCLLHQRHILPHCAGQIGDLLTGTFPFRGCHILLPIANTTARCDPTERETAPFYGKAFALFRL